MDNDQREKHQDLQNEQLEAESIHIHIGLIGGGCGSTASDGADDGALPDQQSAQAPATASQQACLSSPEAQTPTRPVSGTDREGEEVYCEGHQSARAPDRT